MPLEEQCEYLSYDASQWEFPRERLHLGEASTQPAPPTVSYLAEAASAAAGPSDWSPESHPFSELMPESPAYPPPGLTCPSRSESPDPQPGLPVPRPPRSRPATPSRVGPPHLLLGEDAGLPVCLSSPSALSAPKQALPVWQRGSQLSSPILSLPSWPSTWVALWPIPLHPHLHAAHLAPAPCPHRESPGPRGLRESGGSLSFWNQQGQQL